MISVDEYFVLKSMLQDEDFGDSGEERAKLARMSLPEPLTSFEESQLDIQQYARYSTMQYFLVCLYGLCMKVSEIGKPFRFLTDSQVVTCILCIQKPQM